MNAGYPSVVWTTRPALGALKCSGFKDSGRAWQAHFRSWDHFERSRLDSFKVLPPPQGLFQSSARSSQREVAEGGELVSSGVPDSFRRGHLLVQDRSDALLLRHERHRNVLGLHASSE